MPADFLTPVRLGDLVLPNRVFMAPLTRLRALQPGAIPHELNALYYAQRASAGLIIAEATAISPRGQGYWGAPGLFTDDQQAGWSQVVEAVHRAGGRIFLQLWHVGAVSHPDLQPGGDLPLAPSAINPGGSAPTPEGLKTRVTARPMEIPDIRETVADYARATQRAKSAGFDGVEIHAANGYLIEQFLLSGTNHRDDDYGGSLEGRLRFMLEVVHAVTEAWGDSRRVGIRFSPAHESGVYREPDRARLFQTVFTALQPFSLGYVHCIEPRVEVEHAADSLLELSVMTFRPFLSKGTLLVSAGGHSAESGRQTLQTEAADAIAYGRLFISNPDLPRRLQEGLPLQDYDRKTFYHGGAKGYTDYPAWSD